MRNNHMHSAFVSSHMRGAFRERLGYLDDLRRGGPDLFGRVHIATGVTFEETIMNHLRKNWKPQLNPLGFQTLDEDYSTVECYLRQSFRSRPSIYVSDIADALSMDYGIVREIIAKMIREGKLTTK